MQPDTSYQLLEPLGSCQVGKVWSAVDAQGKALAVAVLDQSYATDQRWRDAFASAAYALYSQDGETTYINADFAAPAPWVACAAGENPEQIFIALGMEYHPSPPAAPASPTAPSSPAAPSAALAADEPTQQMPLAKAEGSAGGETPPADASRPSDDRPGGWGAALSESPSSPVPNPLPPASGTPSPTSGAPQSPMAGPSAPVTDVPQPLQFQYQPYPPLASSAPEPTRRTGLWVGLAVVLVVALVAVGGFFAWRSTGGQPTATGSTSPSQPTESISPEPVAFPTGAPKHPGVEPPKPGSWPAEPKFVETDQVRTENLPGLGFQFKVPVAWACDTRDRAPGLARYVCGIARPGVPEVGGEIIVRNCPKPCGPEVQTAYRKAEEAWGLQWIQVGDSTFAETSRLNGESRYGLVVVGWWRSRPEGPIDREIVIRMTAVGAQVSEVRKVANDIRDAVSF